MLLRNKNWFAVIKPARFSIVDGVDCFFFGTYQYTWIEFANNLKCTKIFSILDSFYHRNRRMSAYNTRVLYQKPLVTNKKRHSFEVFGRFWTLKGVSLGLGLCRLSFNKQRVESIKNPYLYSIDFFSYGYNKTLRNWWEVLMINWRDLSLAFLDNGEFSQTFQTYLLQTDHVISKCDGEGVWWHPSILFPISEQKLIYLKDLLRLLVIHCLFIN